MAKIISKIPLSFSLDGYVVYPSEDGVILKGKTGFTTEGLIHFPCYSACRDQSSEFGRASHVGKLLRMALTEFLPKGVSRSYVNRLTSVLRLVLHHDQEHEIGKKLFEVAFRSLAARELLSGFSFVKDGVPLKYVLLADRLRLYSKGWKRKHREGWFGFRVIALEVDFTHETSRVHYGMWQMIPKERMEKYFRFYLPPVADSNAQVFYLLQSQLYAEDQGSFVPVASDVENLYFL